MESSALISWFTSTSGRMTALTCNERWQIDAMEVTIATGVVKVFQTISTTTPGSATASATQIEPSAPRMNTSTVDQMTHVKVLLTSGVEVDIEHDDPDPIAVVQNALLGDGSKAGILKGLVPGGGRPIVIDGASIAAAWVHEPIVPATARSEP